jgi:hypothetical protein
MKLTIHLQLVPRPRNAWSYTSSLQYVFVAWCSVKHMDNFTTTTSVVVVVHVNFMLLRNPWTVDSCSAAPRNLPRNTKLHHSVHKSPQFDHIVSQLNKVHTLTAYFPIIHFNINLLFKPRSSKKFISLTISVKNVVCISQSSSVFYIFCSSHYKGRSKVVPVL